ncbi:hypothetical protein JAAARDRAFT_406050 [Jaapia argillacea MUCL 33604]|uniref:Uncharacterized protein n=1 Tax=Jaapia argillacea MUCL 33604 TaxID=933084 RepID=A0A067PHS0_9AGAM|nr:hypothetical protein JAAARDRAFT_406050 [Jaapia argillacea MUCL 33604]
MCGERNYRAILTCLWIEGLLYGSYLPLFLGSAYICAYTRPNKYLLTLAASVFVVCTIQALLDFATLLYTPEIVANTFCTGGVCLGCDGDTESRVNQIELQDILWMIVDAGGIVNQLMADGLLIYRAFVLWKPRFWVIVIPTTTLLGTVVCGLLHTYATSQTYLIRLHAPLSETTPPPKWVTLEALDLTALSIESALITTTNVLTTALIAYRIWWITVGLSRALGGRATRKYYRVLTMIVESGGIYTMSIITRLAFMYVLPDDRKIFIIVHP